MLYQRDLCALNHFKLQTEKKSQKIFRPQNFFFPNEKYKLRLLVNHSVLFSKSTTQKNEKLEFPNVFEQSKVQRPRSFTLFAFEVKKLKIQISSFYFTQKRKSRPIQNCVALFEVNFLKIQPNVRQRRDYHKILLKYCSDK